jgi:hypothetical protein
MTSDHYATVTPSQPSTVSHEIPQASSLPACLATKVDNTRTHTRSTGKTDRSAGRLVPDATPGARRVRGASTTTDWGRPMFDSPVNGTFFDRSRLCEKIKRWKHAVTCAKIESYLPIIFNKIGLCGAPQSEFSIAEGFY